MALSINLHGKRLKEEEEEEEIESNWAIGAMRKRARATLDTAAVDVWKREIGELSTGNFAHRLGASEVNFILVLFFFPFTLT